VLPLFRVAPSHAWVPEIIFPMRLSKPAETIHVHTTVYTECNAMEELPCMARWDIPESKRILCADDVCMLCHARQGSAATMWGMLP